ncbi:MAG: sugar ABC transporter permease [bacterium]
MTDKIKDFIDRYAGLFLSMPAFVILFLFVIYPFILAIIDSFTNQSLKTILNPELKQFVGFANYRELFISNDFLNALKNTLYFVIVVVPMQTAIALLFAVIVNGAGLWRKILRAGFFIPVVTSMAVLSVIWALLYNPSFGTFNAFFRILGIPIQPFLDSPSQAMNCIIAMSVWQGVGFQMMIFLAGMQVIPGQLYEVASVEDANAWQKFRYITFPMLRNTTIFVVFITTIFAFKLFVQPHMITRGGPQGATQTLILLLYNEAFTNGRYGKASAIAVIFFIIVLGATFIQKRLLPEERRS